MVKQAIPTTVLVSFHLVQQGVIAIAQRNKVWEKDYLQLQVCFVTYPFQQKREKLLVRIGGKLLCDQLQVEVRSKRSMEVQRCNLALNK